MYKRDCKKGKISAKAEGTPPLCLKIGQIAVNLRVMNASPVLPVQIPIVSPLHWQEYALLDSGGFEKLERFGDYILARPEPQAIWPKAWPERQWEQQAHALFRKEKNNPEKGAWDIRRKMPEIWPIRYAHKGLDITLKLSLTGFKHVGLFPEQADNWDYIYQRCQDLGPGAKVLNLFAYTGAASLAARAAGADVTHVDAVKPVITWARENMERSHLSNIRWMVEDALRFVEREDRRGNTYQGIILDPPAYGRGPNGEKWLLEEHLTILLEACAKILDPQRHFLVINLYSLGFSALITENLIRSWFGAVQNAEWGELCLPDQSGRRLPLGTFYRFHQS